MIGDIRVLDGNSFLLSGPSGDIDPAPSSPNGLFTADTRFLSKWVLTVNGERLYPVSVDDLQYFETRFFLVPGTAAHYIDPALSIVRHRMICGPVEELVEIANHDERPVDLQVRIEAGADFASVLETMGSLQKVGECRQSAEDGTLRLSYRRGGFRRETTITSSAPADVDENGFGFAIHLPPGGEWSTRMTVLPLIISVDGVDIREELQGPALSAEQKRVDLEQWLAAAPVVNCDSEALSTAYKRSLVDLAALRFRPFSLPGESIPAAGLPWFMAMLGRDSILTSLQALPFVPAQAASTLRLLGAWQGTRFDDFRDEDPGRIMHQFRFGERTAFEEVPESPSFSSVDATPLYLVLLDEYERWTGDHDLVRVFEPEARAAVNWIDEYADLMGNGYIWYEPRNRETGLENQSWKVSSDAISYRDGRLPGFPRATCEVQGYAYDAKLRTARLARQVWGDPEWADRLERDAEALKDRFNRDFWLEDGEYYALGLDADGGRIDALASNMGHLLWSGIVPPDRARKVADRLMSPALFSGWGVRTLAKGEGRYNPLGYHVGTVWPFDNSFIAWGLRRYGFNEEAGLIAQAMIDAAGFFNGRLPEAFAGYDRERTRYPVEYPAACGPHAWSAGAPMLLIRTMLGLDPHEDHLAVRPALPRGMGHLEVLDIPVRWGRRDAFARGLLPVS